MTEKRGLFKFLKIDHLLENLVHFVETKIELAKIEAKEEIAKVLVSVTSILLMSVLGLLMIIFFSCALGFYLNTVLESPYLGFVIVGGIYAIILLAVILFRKMLPIEKFVTQILDKS